MRYRYASACPRCRKPIELVLELRPVRGQRIVPDGVLGVACHCPGALPQAVTLVRRTAAAPDEEVKSA
jgi:hypothetical protein